ncbi:hypothetical protein E2L08_05730 [Palleronia sediminis]|uniref:Zinc finger/thioredoxin putative domain-containing protein n=1 Tax=Palleronia sediminis TaxID=2547833 RepID=A0A4R6AEX0_9RHOB|nr:zinc-ribbon domain-containing protein [Palleronia sediminis]TDL81612.1 hypothetical protein E2L08_05730 [Palleronia sediminis]
MRLTCPNCAAEYEIDPGLIPENGRDVQCSTCGHMWFFTPPGARIAPPAPRPEDIADDDDDGGDGDDAGDDGFEPPEPPKRELDPETRRILREEAEREAAARRTRRAEAEAEARATADTDAAQDAPEPAAGPLDAAMHEGPQAVPDPASPGAPPRIRRTTEDARRAAASRGDLLPDIDEINSTLTGRSAGPDADPEGDESGGRGGFRVGFALVVALGAGLVALYLLAPALAEAVPSLRPALAGYVEAANGMRAQVDALLQSAASAIAGLAG